MKKELYQKSMDMIEAMEQNTFLLPESWAEIIQLSDSPLAYKTYVGGRGASRYINIEIYNYEKRFDGKSFAINIRKQNIEVDGDSPFGKRVTAQQVHDIIAQIFKDKHSFENHDSGVRTKREKISTLKRQIQTAKRDIAKLEQELSDGNKIKTK
jgi:hypothetical protein